MCSAHFRDVTPSSAVSFGGVPGGAGVHPRGPDGGGGRNNSETP